jgi:hypothetical protein
MSDEKEANDVKGVVVEAAGVAQEKQGKKCCGCCCDFRRAVVVTAWICIVYSIVYMILAIVGVGLGTAVATQNDDEDIAKDAAGAAGLSALYAIGFAFGICFGVFQLMAALKYNVCMLSTCVVFQLLALAYQIYNTWLGATTSVEIIFSVIFTIIVFCAIWIYPLVGLIKEIKEGIMNEETYPREAYSCCCAPNVQTV